MRQNKKYQKVRPHKPMPGNPQTVTPTRRIQPMFSIVGCGFKVSLPPVSVTLPIPRNLDFKQFDKGYIAKAITTITGGIILGYDKTVAEQLWREVHEKN